MSTYDEFVLACEAAGNDHVEFEGQVLSIDRAFLPECARKVRITSSSGLTEDEEAEYWAFLISQLDA
jgi:hypothetical protein